MAAIDITVVIPAYNEEKRIGMTLQQVDLYLKTRNFLFEIIVVDDGSNDQTCDIVNKFATESSTGCDLHIFRNTRNLGKAFSVIHGISRAKGKLVLMTDADLSTPIEEFSKLENAVIREKYDMAIGSRDMDESLILVHQTWLREKAGKFYNRLIRKFIHLPFYDTQCGFKLFKMETCKDIFKRLSIKGLGFDVEILFIALKFGLAIKEVPVIWEHKRGGKIHLIPDGFGMIYDLFKIRFNQLIGKYDLTY